MNASRDPKIATNGHLPNAGLAPHQSEQLPVNLDLHNHNTRQRDNRKNRLPSSGAAAVPMVPLISVRETDVDETIEKIGQKNAFLPGILRWFYDRLLETIRLYRKTVQHVTDGWQARQRRIASHNERLDLTINRLKEEKAVTLQSLETTLAKLDQSLSRAHLAAAQECGKLGVAYVPDRTSEADLIRQTPRSLASLAGEQDLPYAPEERSGETSQRHLFFLCIVVGLFLAISLGTYCRSLLLSRIVDTPLLLLIWWIGGTGLAFAQQRAVEGLWGRVGLHSLLPWDRKQSLRIFAAILGSGALTLAELTVEKLGILALRISDALYASVSKTAVSPSDSPDLLTLYAAPMIVSLGLAVLAAVEGFNKKRTAAVENRLVALQEGPAREADNARRAEPLVQSALIAVSTVACLRRDHDLLSARIKAVQSHYDAQCADIAQHRRSLDDDLTQPERDRIEDALDECHHAQSLFDGLLWSLLLAVLKNDRGLHRIDALKPKERKVIPLIAGVVVILAVMAIGAWLVHL